MTAATQDYTSKIRKLFDTAESLAATSPEAAETYREQAYKLMEKRSVTMAELEAERLQSDPNRTEPIVHERLTFTGSYRRGTVRMAASIVYGFDTMQAYQVTDVDVFDEEDGKFKTAILLYVVGFQSDVEQTVMLVKSLELQAQREMKSWWKAHKDDYWWLSSSQQFHTKRQFLISFGQGAGRKIRETKQDHARHVSKATELVLISRKDRVKKHLDETMKLRKSTSHLRGGTSSAADAGWRAGQRADTGQARVGNDKKKFAR